MLIPGASHFPIVYWLNNMCLKIINHIKAISSSFTRKRRDIQCLLEYTSLMSRWDCWPVDDDLLILSSSFVYINKERYYKRLIFTSERIKLQPILLMEFLETFSTAQLISDWGWLRPAYLVQVDVRATTWWQEDHTGYKYLRSGSSESGECWALGSWVLLARAPSQFWALH